MCLGDAFHTWDFEKRKPNFCAREIFKNFILILTNSNTKINQIIKLKNQIKNIEIINYNLYFLSIDANMLLGIENFLSKKKDKARATFKEVVNIGEKYHKYSKMNYYDIINCAYSWLVYYCYNDNKYKEAKKYCKKVLDNYLEVKNDANYFVLEKESVDICKKYLEEIKKNSYFFFIRIINI